MPGEFIDTNVLLYVTSPDPAKAAHARALIGRRPAVSVQVLNETARVVSAKFKREWPDVADLLDSLAPLLDIHPLTYPMHQAALRLAARYRLAWWDALLVAAALTIGCHTFWSEDMHHGLRIDGRLTVVNPFLA